MTLSLSLYKKCPHKNADFMIAHFKHSFMLRLQLGSVAPCISRYRITRMITLSNTPSCKKMKKIRNKLNIVVWYSSSFDMNNSVSVQYAKMLASKDIWDDLPFCPLHIPKMHVISTANFAILFTKLLDFPRKNPLLVTSPLQSLLLSHTTAHTYKHTYRSSSPAI